MKKLIGTLFTVAIILFGCKDALKEKGSARYISEINDWHAKRISNLKKENGWLNLVGLHWLKQGENKIGSAKNNDAVFPENSPLYIGTITLRDTIIEIRVNTGVEVFCDGKKVEKMRLHTDASGKPELLSLGSLRWNLIKRQQKIGIRLRDLEVPLVKKFPGVQRFPVKDDWKIEAILQTEKSPQKIPVPNILGMIDTSLVAGTIVFEKDGKKFQLDALDEGEKLFIIFADETSGKETYGAGRFLYVDKPKPGEKFFIDFNRAYNPPCNFTKFATCPLPPKQNHLKLAITAGEKKFEEE